MKRNDYICYLIVFGVLVLIGVVVLVPIVTVTYGRSGSLYTSVQVSGIRSHLQQFQKIADTYGNRDPLKGGFNASISYVMQQLVGMGYQPLAQPFTYGYFEVVRPAQVLVGDVSLSTTAAYNIAYSGSGEVTGPLLNVAEGCSSAEYPANYPGGGVALVFDSASCTTQQRVDVASQMKAVAVMIVQSFVQNRSLVGGSLSGPSLAPFPVLSVSALVGQSMRSGSVGFPVSISTKNKATTAYSANVIVETPGGDPTSVIVVGAHLDSVNAGPGINDNGSGSATILEIALEMARLGLLSPVNKIRFIWFGGEEKGLLGSKYYTSSLSPDEAYRIAMMLDFDMLGSPNYMLGVYDGSVLNSGSAVIRDAFKTIAERLLIPVELTPLTGRSDYGPFQTLCPVGGLFTGAEVVKNSLEQTSFGGMVNVPFDPCYHLECDTIENISWNAIDQAATLSSWVVQHFGYMQGLRHALGFN